MRSYIKTSLTATVLALAMLTGCATRDMKILGEGAEGAVLEIPAEWARLDGAYAGASTQWIDALEDPGLSALVQESMSENPSLALAETQVARARGLARQAGSKLLPSLNASMSSDTSGLVDGGSKSAYAIGASLSWEADLWGRLKRQRNAAENSLAAVEADYRGTRNVVAASVAETYFVAIEAQLQADIARSVVSALEEIERIVTLRADNGLASAQDVASVKRDLAVARDRVVEVDGAVREASRALEVLLGRYPSAELALKHDLPAIPPYPAAGLPSELIERRPDIIAAERQIAAAMDSLSVAKAAKLPQFRLTGELGGRSSDLENILSPDNLAWRAASALLVPIFNGGALDAQIDIADADVNAALANYVGRALTAFSEVESALDQITVLEDRRKELAEAALHSEQALSLARIRYTSGEVDLLEVLIAQQKVFEAKSNLLSVERAQRSQYVALCLALGGDWGK